MLKAEGFACTWEKKKALFNMWCTGAIETHKYYKHDNSAHENSQIVICNITEKPYRSLPNVHSMSQTDILQQEQNAVQRIIVLLHSIFSGTAQPKANRFNC